MEMRDYLLTHSAFKMAQVGYNLCSHLLQFTQNRICYLNVFDWTDFVERFDFGRLSLELGDNGIHRQYFTVELNELFLAHTGSLYSHTKEKFAATFRELQEERYRLSHVQRPKIAIVNANSSVQYHPFRTLE